MPLNFHAMTDKGDNREFNEDFVDGFIHEGVLFMLVADGQGGQETGQIASHVAVSELRRYIESEFKRGKESELEKMLRHGFYLAHRVVEGVRMGDPGRYQGLCTSLTAVALTEQKRITFAHVGNTKFFLFREGSLIQMTKDHTVAQQLLNERKISPSDLLTHPERSIITQGVGVFPDITPEVTSGAVQEGDILLTVSDGITEHIVKDEIVRIIDMAGNVQTAAEYLIQGANERGGYDNLSAMVSYVNF